MNRADRRRNKIKARRKRLRISKYPAYKPSVGWEKTKKDAETGEKISLGYMKYPKNSNSQRHLKRLSNKKVRKCKDMQNGNHYRRCLDYKWKLY